MGRRARKRRAAAEAVGTPGSGSAPSTTAYPLQDGSVLTLRDQLSAGTLKQLDQLDARPAADAEDRWQRRVEFLFERLAVRWEIAGLPLEGQKELLGRYRMASADERRRVREALATHLRERHRDVEI